MHVKHPGAQAIAVATPFTVIGALAGVITVATLQDPLESEYPKAQAVQTVEDEQATQLAEQAVQVPFETGA